MNHKDAWSRLKGYVDTQELAARADHEVLELPGGEEAANAYLDVVAYMEVVEAEYGLVQEASPNRKR